MYRFPEKIGGNLAGVHYIRDVADADALIQSLVNFFFLSVVVCAMLTGGGTLFEFLPPRNN